jgi:hypothetical protein
VVIDYIMVARTNIFQAPLIAAASRRQPAASRQLLLSPLFFFFRASCCCHCHAFTRAVHTSFPG